MFHIRHQKLTQFVDIFNEAVKHARIMDSKGYVDASNYIEHLYRSNCMLCLFVVAGLCKKLYPFHNAVPTHDTEHTKRATQRH